MNALLARRSPRVKPPALFVVVAALMYAIDGVIAHSSQFLEQPGLLSAAVSFDLTIGVTFAYWLIVVRRKSAAPRTIVAVFVLSIAAAAATLPAGHRDLVRYIRYAGIPFELAIIALIVIGVRRGRRSLVAAGTELDVPERIRIVFRGSGMNRLTADILATETSMLYFALASWRRKPFIPSNATAFSYHRKNGYAAVLYALIPITLVESIAVDLVMRVHHPLAANILLAVDLFAAIWLLGFARAVQLRPILVTSDEVQIRNGIQWHLDVPRASIERIDVGRVAAPAKRTPGYLRAALGTPNALITLRGPLEAYGPYGMTRTVNRVGLVVDDLASFQRTIER